MIFTRFHNFGIRWMWVVGISPPLTKVAIEKLGGPQISLDTLALCLGS